MPDEIKLIVDGNGVVVDWDERALDDDQAERLETYVPISRVKEKLLSPKAIDAFVSTYIQREGLTGLDHGQVSDGCVEEAIEAAIANSFPDTRGQLK